ncbi:MAG: hypothetical protein R3C03_20695 [Pirellulaceae bacterium]
MFKFQRVCAICLFALTIDAPEMLKGQEIKLLPLFRPFPMPSAMVNLHLPLILPSS